jgi:hypothetical protein
MKPPASPPGHKVFISYSRKDRERIEPIVAALEARGMDVLRDTDDILPTELWRERLEDLIVQADQVVFVLSPHSAGSEVCAWEASFAEQLNKRIAPIVVADLHGAAVPAPLARLNYLFLTPPADPPTVLAQLCDALTLDIGWIREHTRLGELGRRWASHGERSDLMLRGKALEAAEAWAAAPPPDAPSPTAAQLHYIHSSRVASTRRLRRNIASLGGLLVLAMGAAVVAWLQYQQAQANAVQAQANAERAQSNAEEARQQALIARAEASFSRSFTAVMLSTAADPLRDQPRLKKQDSCEHVLYQDANGQKVRYGLLPTFCAIRSVLGLESLEELSREKIFVGGPHVGGVLKLQEARDFGRYNTAFVRWFAERILPDENDLDFIERTQSIYDEFARYLVRSFYLTYIHSAQHPDFFRYERRLLELQVAPGAGGERPLSDNWNGPSLLDFYKLDTEFPEIVFDFESIGFSADQVTHLSSQAFNQKLYDLRAPVRFWTRRSLDGSAEAVFLAVRKLVRAYDKDFTAKYELTGLAKASLPALETLPPGALPRLTDLPLAYRQPWGEQGERMPQRY